MKQNEEEKKFGLRERSVAYPSLDLESAINQVSKLFSELGKGPYSREDAAKGLGYSGISGASARAVAALVQYGLLNRSGNAYEISELAEEIISPTDETGEKRRLSIIIAAKLPKLFQRIIDRFQGQALPGLLDNILVRDGVNRKYAKEVVQILKETFQFSGIIQNGIISNSTNIDINEKSKNKADGDSLNLPSYELVDGASQKSSPYTFNDLGNGWSIFVKATKPITPEIKRLLINVSEKLDENQIKE